MLSILIMIINMIKSKFRFSSTSLYYNHYGDWSSVFFFILSSW